MLEDLKKLALEAIRIKTRIKADTEKLQEIKNQVVEKSKDRNSSYTIKVDDGSIRIIKYKRLIYFKLNQRGFDKLDNETKNNLLKNKLVKIKFSVNYDGYEEASNKNSVPNDPQKPFVTSGIRLGTAAITTRGFLERETKTLGNLICDVLDNIDDEAKLSSVKEKVLNLTSQYPVYSANKKAVA